MYSFTVRFSPAHNWVHFFCPSTPDFFRLLCVSRLFSSDKKKRSFYDFVPLIMYDFIFLLLFGPEKIFMQILIFPSFSISLLLFTRETIKGEVAKILISWHQTLKRFSWSWRNILKQTAVYLHSKSHENL
jgi:hypothetical protein